MPKLSWWLHFKGGLYQLLGVAQDANFDWDSIKDKASPEEQAQAAIDGNIALYKGADGVVWCRPLKEFIGDHPSGVKRFVMISEQPIPLGEAKLLANKMIAGIK